MNLICDRANSIVGLSNDHLSQKLEENYPLHTQKIPKSVIFHRFSMQCTRIGPIDGTHSAWSLLASFKGHSMCSL